MKSSAMAQVAISVGRRQIEIEIFRAIPDQGKKHSNSIHWRIVQRDLLNFAFNAASCVRSLIASNSKIHVLRVFTASRAPARRRRVRKFTIQRIAGDGSSVGREAAGQDPAQEAGY